LLNTYLSIRCHGLWGQSKSRFTRLEISTKQRSRVVVKEEGVIVVSSTIVLNWNFLRTWWSKAEDFGDSTLNWVEGSNESAAFYCIWCGCCCWSSILEQLLVKYKIVKDMASWKRRYNVHVRSSSWCIFMIDQSEPTACMEPIRENIARNWSLILLFEVL
jgi:hypothetical protein